MLKIPDSLVRAGVAARSALVAALEMQDAYLLQLEEFINAGEPAPAFQPVDGCTHPAEGRRPIPGGNPGDFLCSGCRRTSDELKGVA